MKKTFYVYILTNRRNGTLYTGVTSDLVRRISEHKQCKTEGFTKKYGVNRLVYYEIIDTAEEAIRREKQIKAWQRSWKLREIENNNPNWDDLYEQIL